MRHACGACMGRSAPLLASRSEVTLKARPGHHIPWAGGRDTASWGGHDHQRGEGQSDRSLHVQLTCQTRRQSRRAWLRCRPPCRCPTRMRRTRCPHTTLQNGPPCLAAAPACAPAAAAGAARLLGHGLLRRRGLLVGIAWRRRTCIKGASEGGEGNPSVARQHSHAVHALPRAAAAAYRRILRRSRQETAAAEGMPAAAWGIPAAAARTRHAGAAGTAAGGAGRRLTARRAAALRSHLHVAGRPPRAGRQRRGPCEGEDSLQTSSTQSTAAAASGERRRRPVGSQSVSSAAAAAAAGSGAAFSVQCDQPTPLAHLSGGPTWDCAMARGACVMGGNGHTSGTRGSLPPWHRARSRNVGAAVRSGENGCAKKTMRASERRGPATPPLLRRPQRAALVPPGCSPTCLAPEWQSQRRILQGRLVQ